MIRLLIFLLAAGFGDKRNPSHASLPIWLQLFGSIVEGYWMCAKKERGRVTVVIVECYVCHHH